MPLMPVVRSFAVPILSSGFSFDRSAASCWSFRKCGAAMLMRRPWRLAIIEAGTRALLNANVAQGMVAYQGRPDAACASTRSDVASGMKVRVG